MSKKQPTKERSLIIIKPDGVQRSLIGEIIGRFERAGLKLVALKMVLATREEAIAHYNKDEAWLLKVGESTIKNLEEKPTKTALEYGQGVFEGLLKYLTCSPIVIGVFEGNQAVGIAKKLIGGTEPLLSDVGTIRGDFTLDSYSIANGNFRAVRNLAHCSDKVEEAEREIKLWFKDNEILNYIHIAEGILYDVNLDGFLE